MNQDTEELALDEKQQEIKASIDALLELYDHRDFLIPLGPRREAHLKMPRDLSTEEWNQFLAVLHAMKSGLIDEPRP